MNNYETVFILTPVLSEDQTKEAVGKFKKTLKSCGAKLAFGQHKTGDSLFPKRKAADGSYDNKTRGWFKWSPQSQQ